MPLNDLLAFVEAARAGSMTQASIRLGRVQSSVSLRIKHLEEKLGVKLFERTSHGLELTAVGSAFLPRARDIISQWDAALLQINHVNGSAVVNVGIEITEIVRLPKLVSSLLDRNHDIDVRVSAVHSSVLMRYIKEGRLDIAVAAKSGATRFDARHRLHREKVVIAFKGKVNYRERGATFIALTHSKECVFYDGMMQYFAGFGAKPTVVECGNYDVIRCHLEREGTITFLPESMASHIEGVIMHPIVESDDAASYEIGLIKRDSIHGPAIDQVNEALFTFYGADSTGLGQSRSRIRIPPNINDQALRLSTN